MAHATYLSQITSKGLLSPDSGLRGRLGPKEDDSIFLAMLHAILKIMLRYKEAVDGLYGYSVAEYSRRQELAARVETRTKEGRWGLTESDYHDTTDAESRASTPSLGFQRGASTRPESASGLFQPAADNEELLPAIRLRLKTMEEEFKSLCKTLLEELAYQSDSEMRMLGVQLNFNMYYDIAIRKGKKDKEKEKEKQREREREAERERRKEREKERERRKEKERKERRDREKMERERREKTDEDGDIMMA